MRPTAGVIRLCFLLGSTLESVPQRKEPPTFPAASGFFSLAAGKLACHVAFNWHLAVEHQSDLLSPLEGLVPFWFPAITASKGVCLLIYIYIYIHILTCITSIDSLVQVIRAIDLVQSICTMSLVCFLCCSLRKFPCAIYLCKFSCASFVQQDWVCRIAGG